MVQNFRGIATEKFLISEKKSRVLTANLIDMQKYIITVFLLLLGFALMAQSDNPDFMRSMGKMYVVVAVIGSIFVGLIIYLIYLDKKLTKLENQIKESNE